LSRKYRRRRDRNETQLQQQSTSQNDRIGINLQQPHRRTISVDNRLSRQFARRLSAQVDVVQKDGRMSIIRRPTPPTTVHELTTSGGAGTSRRTAPMRRVRDRIRPWTAYSSVCLYMQKLLESKAPTSYDCK
jgi:hypothetical protein